MLKFPAQLNIPLQHVRNSYTLDKAGECGTMQAAVRIANARSPLDLTGDRGFPQARRSHPVPSRAGKFGPNIFGRYAMTQIKGAITAILALSTAIPLFVRSCYQEYRRLDRFAKNCSPTYEGRGR